MTAPLGAQVWAVPVEEGTRVEKGDEVVVLSAMKTETAVTAPVGGIVEKLACKAGQIVTPGFYARNIQRLWNMLHEGGRREILIEREGVARSRTWDWPGHHPLMCDVAIETMCAVFELTGRQDVVAARRSCVSDGAEECVVDVHWRSPG